MAKVLIVDDNMDMLDTLEHLFMFYDFQVVRAVNGREAISTAKSQKPDVIVLDGLMPVMNGFEACEVLKKEVSTRDIPIIFLSANYTEEEHRQEGFKLGADEYMLKPFNAKELIAKVQQLLHHRQLIEKLRSENQSRITGDFSSTAVNHLKTESSEVDNSQILDALTGLYNNTHFLEKLHLAVNRYRQQQESLTLLLVDLDNFKQINSAFGDYAGDYVLMRTANVILVNCALTSSVFRMGRNRFSILFHGMESQDCFYEAEKMRSAISQTSFFDGNLFESRFKHTRRRSVDKRLTASIGLAEVEPDEAPTQLLRRAEQALMKAKAKGRNMTIRHSEILPEKLPGN